MKKILLIASLGFSIIATAQVSGLTEISTQPAITAAGKPSGKLIEKKIGKEGGIISSTDGKLELKIPPGALSKNTTISILPLTNMAPNGNGIAYRLEPSGIQFKQPVKLVLHYTSEESAHEMQMLLGIAMQDKKGQWYSLKKFSLDTVAKTLSGNINHFSDWSKFEAWKINPLSARLKVNKTIEVGVYGTAPVPEGNEDELTELGDPFLAPLTKPKFMSVQKWTVNSITNGNSSVGTTSPIHETKVNYKAPASVPNQNPVAVEAHLTGIDIKINGKKINELRLVSNILIYDNAYEVNMMAYMAGGGPESWGGYTNYLDRGSFVVSMDKEKPEVIDIQNKLEILENNCDKTIFNKETCTGILHISGVKSIRVIPANPPSRPYREIEIMFVQRPVEYTKFSSDCPPPPSARERSKDNGVMQSAMATMLGMKTPGFPVHVKFFAKPGEQEIYPIGKEFPQIVVKYTVKQIQDE